MLLRALFFCVQILFFTRNPRLIFCSVSFIFHFFIVYSLICFLKFIFVLRRPFLFGKTFFILDVSLFKSSFCSIFSLFYIAVFN